MSRVVRGPITILLLGVTLVGGACVSTADPSGNVGILSFTADTVHLVADGASVDTLTVKLDPNAIVPATTVSFATNLGTFLGASSGGGLTVAADSTGFVKAILKAGSDTGTALVTATVDGVTQTLPIPIGVALPETLTVAADPPVLKDSSGATITVVLLRSRGTPTPGSVVTLSATSGVLSPSVVVATSNTITSKFAAVQKLTAATTITVAVHRQIAGKDSTVLTTSVPLPIILPPGGTQ